MRQLAGELRELSGAVSVPTPAAERWRGYPYPAAPPIPEGSTRIPMDRRAAVVAALGAAVGASRPHPEGFSSAS